MAKVPTRDDGGARRLEAIAGWAVGGVAFVVYVLTLYRTVPGGDSGELIGAVVSGGVIHPPGYPLYSLLGSVFLHVPFGSIAFRLNLLSAVTDALAAALLTRSVARVTSSLSGGVVTGALFAFAPGVWSYAIVTEVFALNNLAIALLLWLGVLYEETKGRRYALLGAFVLGLGLANHQTVLFTGVPIVLWAALSSKGELLRPRVFMRLVFAGAVGLLPYLYLPILASHRAFVSWGAADTWDGFWTHVLRREYGTFRLAPVGVGSDVFAGDVLIAWWNHTLAQAGVWGLLLAVIGIAACVRDGWRRPRGLGLVVLVPPALSVIVMMALGNLPIASDLFREILARFWQQPDIYLAVFAGVGFAAVAQLASKLLRLSTLLPPGPPPRRQGGGDVRERAVAHVPPALPGEAGGQGGGVSVRWVMASAALALALFQLGRSYRALDRHANHLVQDYGAEMLRAAPQNGILITKGDLITSSIRYLQLALHVRPDVRLVDQELLATAWGRPLFEKNAPGVVFPGPKLSLDPAQGFQLKQLFDANAGSPMDVCGGLTPGDHTTDASYGLWPSGFCDEVHSGAEPVSIEEWITRSEGAVPHIDFTGQYHPKGSWEDIVWSDYWEVRQARAAHIITIVGTNVARRKYLPVAVDILQHIVDENPDVAPHVHRNLAIAIGRAGIASPEQKQQAIRAWEGFLRVAPPNDPQLPMIHAELARLRQ